MPSAWLVVVSTLSPPSGPPCCPGASPRRIARQVFLWTRVVFRLRVGRSPSYEKRDRIMAMYAPAALIALLTVWLGSCWSSAYTAMFAPSACSPLSRAFELSGSSIFTLGTTTHRQPARRSFLTYSEAGLGLLLLTLLITYLPTIYTTFQRREAAVTLLEVRAGNPPSAVNLLVRYPPHREARPAQRAVAPVGGVVRRAGGIAHLLPRSGLFPLAATGSLVDHRGRDRARRRLVVGRRRSSTPATPTSS